MFKVPVRRSSEVEMITAINDLKKRGFIQLSEVKCTYSEGKSFVSHGKFHGRDRYRFQGNDDNVKYECMMGKVN